MKTQDKKQNPQSEPVIFLKGKRVILRPVDVSDVDKYTTWINDEEIRSFLGVTFPTTRIQEEEWVRSKQSKEEIMLTIETHDGSHIGGMNIFRINWIDRTAETGAMIGDKKYWNNGYGTEAKMLLLRYAFDTLGLRKIHSPAFAYNERSVNYSLKCGYKIIGKQKDEKFKFGAYHDVILLEVFRDQWQKAYDKWTKSQNKKTILKK